MKCHVPYAITQCHPTQVNVPQFNLNQTGWYSTYLPTLQRWKTELSLLLGLDQNIFDTHLHPTEKANLIMIINIFWNFDPVWKWNTRLPTGNFGSQTTRIWWHFSKASGSKIWGFGSLALALHGKPIAELQSITCYMGSNSHPVQAMCAILFTYLLTYLPSQLQSIAALWPVPN